MRARGRAVVAPGVGLVLAVGLVGAAGATPAGPDALDEEAIARLAEQIEERWEPLPAGLRWADGAYEVVLRSQIAVAGRGSGVSGQGGAQGSSTFAMTLREGRVVRTPPFRLVYDGVAYGQSAGGVIGSGEGRVAVDGVVRGSNGFVELDPEVGTFSVSNVVVGGSAPGGGPLLTTPFAADVLYPLQVTAGGCGLVEGTFESTLEWVARAGSMLGADVEVDLDQSFVAVSDEVAADPRAFIDRARGVVEDILDLLGAASSGPPDELATYAAGLVELVAEAEERLARTRGPGCPDLRRFGLGIGFEVDFSILELLRLPGLNPEVLWRLAEAAARAGLGPGSEAVAALRNAIGSAIAEASADLSGSIDDLLTLLQAAAALGDTELMAILAATLSDAAALAESEMLIALAELLEGFESPRDAEVAP